MNDWKLLLDDMAKMAASAMGLADDMRKDSKQKIRLRMEQWLKKMDLVSRQEFEVVQAMLKKSRLEQESLKACIAALEKSLKSKPAAARAGNKKSMPRKRRKN